VTIHQCPSEQELLAKVLNGGKSIAVKTVLSIEGWCKRMYLAVLFQLTVK